LLGDLVNMFTWQCNSVRVHNSSDELARISA